MTDSNSDSPSPLPTCDNTHTHTHLAQLQDRGLDAYAHSDNGDDDDETCPILKQLVTDELTARQLEVLRTAHRAGYFKNPHEHSGEEIADMLDISAATFSEHLRKAQHKLFDAIF